MTAINSSSVGAGSKITTLGIVGQGTEGAEKEQVGLGSKITTLGAVGRCFHISRGARESK